MFVELTSRDHGKRIAIRRDTITTFGESPDAEGGVVITSQIGDSVCVSVVAQDYDLVRERILSAEPQRSKAVRTKSVPEDNGFGRFWEAYPKKIGKGAAAGEWAKLKPSGELVTQIVEAVGVQRTWGQWQRGYIPNPSTWLHQRRWEDAGEESTGNDTRVKGLFEESTKGVRW